MRSASLLLAALAALSLAACDSADPDGGTPPSALVGTWSLQGFETDTYLTATSAQSFVDRSGQPTGQVSATGDQTASLVHVEYLSTGSSSRQARLLSYVPGPSGTPSVSYELILYTTSTSGEAQLTVYRPNGSTSYTTYSNQPTFTFVGARLRVPTLTLRAYSPNEDDIVQIAGDLTFPTVSLVPGQRTRVQHRETAYGSDPFSLGFRYVLEDGGAYRAETDRSLNVTESVSGTWAADGDRLRLSVARDEITETRTFTHVLAGGALRLSYPETGCLTGSDCLRYYEAQVGLDEGALSAYEVIQTSVFTSGAARAASRLLPQEATEQDAALWPRMLARPAAE